MYIYIYIYIYIKYILCSKVSCYLQSTGILFVLCSENNKNICQNQYIKNTSSNEINNIRIQFCKSLSKSCYH